MILTRSAYPLGPISNPTDCVTHANTRHVGPHFVQKWHHMLSFGDCAFEARVEGISREEGEDIGLTGKPRVGAIIVHEGLKARDTADRFSRPGPM